MAAFKPELFTIEEVLNFYDITEGSEYKIYAGTAPNDAYKRYHFEGEKELGSQELTAALMQLQGRNENTNPYLIQVITPSKGKTKNISLTSISFQLNKPPMYMGAIQPQISNRSEMLLEKLVELNSSMNNRINALEANEDLDFEEPEQETGIGAILNNPQIQGMLIGALDKFINGSGVPAGIAGIPKHESDLADAMELVESLMEKGVTVEHLKKLNAMGAMKLQSLLLML